MTLVGILPDNIRSDEPTNALPKLVVYTRINLDAATGAHAVHMALRDPSGEDVVRNDVDANTLATALEGARQDANMIAGILTRIEAAPFRVTNGRYYAVVTIDEQELITGSIKFDLVGA